MKLSERSIKIKELIHDQVDMGTFGLVELELIEFDKEIQQLKILNIPVVMPRILYFTDENGNNVDLNAAGVNAELLRDGTFEYFISYGFAGRKELSPVYGA